MNWSKFQENGIYRVHYKKKTRKRWRKKQCKENILGIAARQITPIMEARSKRMFHNPTKAEATFREILKECGLSKLFKSQQILFHYIIDFFSPHLFLGIEIDGEYHLNPEQIQYDKQRERRLFKKGIKLIHFTNNQVLNQKNIVKRILSDRFSRSSRLQKLRKPCENPKIYFNDEQTQAQLRTMIPSEMARA